MLVKGLKISYETINASSVLTSCISLMKVNESVVQCTAGVEVLIIHINNLQESYNY